MRRYSASKGDGLGLDMRGMTLTEIRRRVRGEEGEGTASFPPGKEPERLGDVLARMGFGPKEQGDDRD
jgi:hypothetical protein